MKVNRNLSGIQKVVDNLESKGYNLSLDHSYNSTIIICKLPTGRTFYSESFCHPNDVFNRVIGTRIAFRRLMSVLHDYFGREELKRILKKQD